MRRNTTPNGPGFEATARTSHLTLRKGSYAKQGHIKSQPRPKETTRLLQHPYECRWYVSARKSIDEQSSEGQKDTGVQGSS
jgi:hypothetical protein